METNNPICPLAPVWLNQALEDLDEELLDGEDEVCPGDRLELPLGFV